MSQHPNFANRTFPVEKVPGPIAKVTSKAQPKVATKSQKGPKNVVEAISPVQLLFTVRVTFPIWVTDSQKAEYGLIDSNRVPPGSLPYITTFIADLKSEGVDSTIDSKIRVVEVTDPAIYSTLVRQREEVSKFLSDYATRLNLLKATLQELEET